MPPRLTPSQRQVMSLYRKGLRYIRDKPEGSQPAFLLYLRHFFKHPSMGGGVSRRDFAAVDYMVRRCERMLESIFTNVTVKAVTVPQGAIDEVKASARILKSGQFVHGQGRKQSY